MTSRQFGFGRSPTELIGMSTKMHALVTGSVCPEGLRSEKKGLFAVWILSPSILRLRLFA